MSEEQSTEGFVRQLTAEELEQEKAYQAELEEFKKRRVVRVGQAIRNGGAGLRITHTEEYSTPLLAETLAAYFGELEPRDELRDVRLPRTDVMDALVQTLGRLAVVLVQSATGARSQAPSSVQAQPGVPVEPTEPKAE